MENWTATHKRMKLEHSLEPHKKMERYSMFLDWKNQYSQNDYTTQGSLQIQ